MAKYRAGIIGLGWMGMLYDITERTSDLFDIDDTERPTPTLDPHLKLHHHEHPGNEGLPGAYADAVHDRPEVDLIAGADRDASRLKIFQERYGVAALYTDATTMLREERLDIVVIATNTRGRADLTRLAVECGASGIVTEKPMANTLEEADRMVSVCADAGVPLCCGAVTTNHPSFARAKELISSGAIGTISSIEAPRPFSQHQNWSYFVDGKPSWVIGVGDEPRRGWGTDEFGGPGGSDEFSGQGMMVTTDGLVLHFRNGAPPIRITGDSGEILNLGHLGGWKLWQHMDTVAGNRRVEIPWPGPQLINAGAGVARNGGNDAVYGLADVIDWLEGRLDEPKNSGRRVCVALEVEIAFKQSSAEGGRRVDLPLQDRSPGLHYDWFR